MTQHIYSKLKLTGICSYMIPKILSRQLFNVYPVFDHCHYFASVEQYAGSDPVIIPLKEIHRKFTNLYGIMSGSLTAKITGEMSNMVVVCSMVVF